ncbi:ubiquinone-dependent pyruvate dehydrogenase [Fulvimarina sp. MAC3]|uniref:ubiquinone-dependent pyruvate dehydrogenase n=1 Tax=Fulvimarina sp. MAC3 TaxID=3148887 RepID=UPI0031FBF668
MAKTIADLLTETLADCGVSRIWGVTGDSLNGIAASLEKQKSIKWMHVRHEEVAAFAAGAEAAVTGELAVCAGSCGPGNLHLINGLFDCQRNHVPVLAIASHIPSSEIGLNYFQETHPTELFKECSDFVELVSNAKQMPEILHRAIRTAIGRQGVAVLVIPGDVSLQEVEEGVKSTIAPLARPAVTPPVQEIDRLAETLDGSEAVTLLCGAGCAGAHDEVVALAERLNSPTVHAYRGKEHIEWENPFDVGMTGLIGFSSGYHAMMECDTLVMLGTDFPYRNFLPKKAKVIQVDRDPSALGRRANLHQAIHGDVKATIDQLLPKIREGRSDAFLKTAIQHYKSARQGLDELAEPRKAGKPLHPQYVARIVDELAAEDAIFTADVGTPAVWAARYLKMNGKRRLVGSFSHGSMANAMPQALGAQGAYPDRQVISLSGDGGLTMLLGDILTAKQMKLPIKMVVFNNGSLGFVEMEMKGAGYLPTNVALDSPDFAQLAKSCGIGGWRVENSDDLKNTLREAYSYDGPALVDVSVARHELSMPPKIQAAQAKGFSLYTLRAIMSGRGDEILELAETNLFR